MNLREAAQQALEALQYIYSETTPKEDEYINAAITALRAALSEEAMQRLTDVQQEMEAVAHPTHIYDFAGWLTTRPGTLVVGSKHEAGPMAEAIGEYLRTFPARFAASRAPQQEMESNCYGDGNVYRGVHSKDSAIKTIYTALPKREWVGLTDEDVKDCHRDLQVQMMGTWRVEDMIRIVEAKLKEKNS